MGGAFCAEEVWPFWKLGSGEDADPPKSRCALPRGSRHRGRRFKTYFLFFGFFAPDFLAEPLYDFFALLPELDFDLAFADFDADDFLTPLSFLALSGALPLLGADEGLLTSGGSIAGTLLTCSGTLILAAV